MVSISGIVTGMTKTDAMAPIIGLEATVTGGRTLQAKKRGGKDEARERLIEESTGAIVWLGGVKCLNKYVGDPILKKMFGAEFDVGTDNILRTPFENFMRKPSSKKFSKKQVALIKGTKVLASVLIADAFIGLVVPPLNQKLTRKLRAKRQNEKNETITSGNTNKNLNNPTFKGGGFGAINAFTHAIENSNTGKLLSTDAGLISGRLYSARNNDERREIAIRDIGSIYFYMWAQNHVASVLNYVETGKSSRLNPNTAKILDKHLSDILDKNGKEMSVEEFRKMILGKKSSEINIPKDIDFEVGKLSSITKFFDKFRKTPTEPLKVIEVTKLEGKFDKEIMDRIYKMSELQPLRQGKAVITKQQIIDAINIAEINNPKLLNDVFIDFTDGKSKNEYKYVSNDKLYKLKGLMEDYVDNICKSAKDGKVTKELLNSAKKKNLTWSGINFIAGFVVAATFLSTLIPKFQYWVTKVKTGREDFPGLYEENNKKFNKAA